MARPIRLVLLCVGLVFAAKIGWHFLDYLRHAIVEIRYPYGLDYGEGIVWQQALLIPGPRMYGDITQFPYIVFHYPPVYHLAVRALAATGVDMLVAGRSISLLSAFVVAGVAARLTLLATPNHVANAAKWAGAAIAALTVFCYEPVVVYGAVMRVDMLAVALSFAGVWCAVTSVGHKWRLYAGAFLFLLAMFTKQTSIAAPLATFPVMLMIDSRRTLAVSAITLLAGVGLLLVLNAYTDGGFLRHIVLYNLNRFKFSAIIDGIEAQWHHTVFLLLTILGSISLWRGWAKERHWTDRAAFTHDLAENTGVRTALVVTLYLIVTTAMIVTVGKSGASNNYLIEVMCVWSVVIGTFVVSSADQFLAFCSGTKSTGHAITHPLLVMALGCLLALQMTVMRTSAGEYSNMTPAYIQALDSLRSRIANTNKPVLSDDMVLLLRAGKEVQWEPAIFAELASQGRWDQGLIIDRIAAHDFAMIVTTERPDSETYHARYTPDVERAIEAAYPRLETLAGRTIHLPAE